MNKIVGGKSTTIENHPYIISITHHNKHICGGAIISRKSVISAAHCFYPKYYCVNVNDLYKLIK